MTIEFYRQPVWNAAKECVQDLAFVDGRLRPWWVSPAALDDLVQSTDDLAPIDYIVILERCRDVLEPIAAAKFALGAPDIGGVTVVSDDLEDQHGRHGRHHKVVDGRWIDPKTGR